jgi:imidazole glycerol-phosphate synthase subunit HisF
VLTVSAGSVVKTESWKKPVSLGDPVNSAQIYSDLGVDELIISDITASKLNRPPDMTLLRAVARNSLVPMGYIGGITQVRQALEVLALGFEKVGLGSAAFLNPLLVRQLAAEIGSQSVFVAVDRIFPRFSNTEALRCAKRGLRLQEFLTATAELGAGEFVVTCTKREGSWAGYDLELISRASAAVSVPVVANGGASEMTDLRLASDAGASGVAASSLFLFRKGTKQLMISYPSDEELSEVFS